MSFRTQEPETRPPATPPPVAYDSLSGIGSSVGRCTVAGSGACSSAKPAERMRRRERLAASFVIVTVVFAAAGCVRGGPAQETTTDEPTTQGASTALFEVATSHPDYWRLFTSDRVDATTSPAHGFGPDEVTHGCRLANQCVLSHVLPDTA